MSLSPKLKFQEAIRGARSDSRPIESAGRYHWGVEARILRRDPEKGIANRYAASPQVGDRMIASKASDSHTALVSNHTFSNPRSASIPCIV